MFLMMLTLMSWAPLSLGTRLARQQQAMRGNLATVPKWDVGPPLFKGGQR